MSTYLPIGIGVGVAIGAIMGNPGAGVAVGIGLAAVLALVFGERLLTGKNTKPSVDNKTSEEDK